MENRIREGEWKLNRKQTNSWQEISGTRDRDVWVRTEGGRTSKECPLYQTHGNFPFPLSTPPLHRAIMYTLHCASVVLWIGNGWAAVGPDYVTEGNINPRSFILFYLLHPLIVCLFLFSRHVVFVLFNIFLASVKMILLIVIFFFIWVIWVCRFPGFFMFTFFCILHPLFFFPSSLYTPFFLIPL